MWNVYHLPELWKEVIKESLQFHYRGNRNEATSKLTALAYDQHAGLSKEQAALAAATTYKHRRRATRAAKLVVITRVDPLEASRRALSRAV